MRTIISGRVSDEMLETAELFGIEASSYMTNGDNPLPFSILPHTKIPPCPKLPGEPGVLQNNWRLVMAADALILKGENEHLQQCAETYGLVVYQEA